MNHAFVTGSRKYGTPRPDSDIDLVIFVESESEYDLLVELADDQGSITCLEEYEGLVLTPLRFAKLNLICCVNHDEWQCWHDGTKQMETKRPIARDAAVALLEFAILAM